MQSSKKSLTLSPLLKHSKDMTKHDTVWHIQFPFAQIPLLSCSMLHLRKVKRLMVSNFTYGENTRILLGPRTMVRMINSPPQKNLDNQLNACRSDSHVPPIINLSAKFCSNSNQKHLNLLIKVFIGILETSRQVCWGRLELNSMEVALQNQWHH